jgi:hypothetical protein
VGVGVDVAEVDLEEAVSRHVVDIVEVIEAPAVEEDTPLTR